MCDTFIVFKVIMSVIYLIITLYHVMCYVSTIYLKIILIYYFLSHKVIIRLIEIAD